VPIRDACSYLRFSKTNLQLNIGKLVNLKSFQHVSIISKKDYSRVEWVILIEEKVEEAAIKAT